MVERWLIALLIARLFGNKAFADCIPAPDTPASVIQYFQKFNKPLPEQFCAKEEAARPPGSSQETQQTYGNSSAQPPLVKGHPAQLPDYIPQQPHPPPYDESFRSGFEWFD
jgi:hypothetical protein